MIWQVTRYTLTVCVCVCLSVCLCVCVIVTCSTLVGCLVVSILRAVSFFGFCGGITNWIAVELFFVKVPLIYGRYVCMYVIVNHQYTLVTFH